MQLAGISKKVSFYIVNNGEINSSSGRFNSNSETPLTVDGLAQAELISSFFTDISIDTIFSSPTLRSVQTTDIIAKNLVKPTYYKHSGLIDKKEGEWEGKTIWEVREHSEKDWSKWSDNPLSFKPPSGESVIEFVARISRAFNDIISRYDIGSNVILSTQEGVIRSFMINFIGVPVDNFFRLDVSPASITQIDMYEDYFILKFFNLNLLA